MEPWGGRSVSSACMDATVCLPRRLHTGASTRPEPESWSSWGERRPLQMCYTRQKQDCISQLSHNAKNDSTFSACMHVYSLYCTISVSSWLGIFQLPFTSSASIRSRIGRWICSSSATFLGKRVLRRVVVGIPL